MFIIQCLSRNIKKILWLIMSIAVYVVYYLIIKLLFALIDKLLNVITLSAAIHSIFLTIGEILLLLGFVAIIVLSIIMWRKVSTRCHSCKKFGAMVFLKEELVSEKNISVPVNLQRKNPKGEIIDIYQQYVPGVRKSFKKIYKCRYCNYTEAHTYTKDIANI